MRKKIRKNDKLKTPIHELSKKQHNIQKMCKLQKRLQTPIRQPPRPTLQLHLRKNNNRIQHIHNRIHNKPILLGKRIPTQKRNKTTKKNNNHLKRTKKEKTNNKHRKTNNHNTPHIKRRPQIPNTKKLQRHRLHTNTI